MLTLIVESAGRRETFTFEGPSVSLGRADDNDLRVSSRFVSQHHARIEALEDGGYKLIDLDSQNGTRVNGEDTSQCRLQRGDRIEISTLSVWFGSAPEETTVSLHAGDEEVTQAGFEEVHVSSRQDREGATTALEDSLHEALLEYRRAFGEERGLQEIEVALERTSQRVFGRPVFQRAAELVRLLDVSRALTQAVDPDRTLALIMDSAIELSDSERGFLVLRDEENQWRVRIARNFDQEAIRGAETKISRGVAEQVARSGQPVLSVNAQDDRRFSAQNSVAQLKLRSLLCVPLRFRDRIIGTLYLDNRFKDGVYSDRDLSLIERLADHAAIAIENATLYQRNRENEQALAARTEEVEELARVLDHRATEATERDAEAPRALSRDGLKHQYQMIIGESPKVIEMLRLLDRVVESDIPVLVSGESGTGKELVAQAIHHNSKRSKRPFVKENCAAIPESLMEAEFFGYKKGAFTGANSDRKGLFEQAHGGTIFLDEIGEMSLDMQSKMLRVLQNGEIRPVGARDIQVVDVRLVTASNRDLKRMVEEGTFREDLFYRLNVINIESPPLRERLEDLGMLVDHFLGMAAEQMGADKKTVDPMAMKYLLAWHWPGNVRELQNQVARAVALSGAVIRPEDLSEEIVSSRTLRPDAPSGGGGLKAQVRLAVQQKEREIVLRALEEADWRKSAAARALEVSRPTLDQKIKQFGLAPYIERGRKR